MTTLDLADNAGLGIEDYYIRFSDQNRSIADDAAEIGAAIELILHRHDPNYPGQPTTNVQVVIIGYSKGTLSSRLYLKNLAAEARTFRPVSEFIAIAPPNHGINVAGPSVLTSTAVQQLVNGHGLNNCSAILFPAATRNFIANLNGHPINDTIYRPTSPTDPTPLPPADNAGEGPDSRSPTERPTDGTLYVTLFATGNRDFVGGDTIVAPPDDDCEGRRLAKNLSADAINIPVAEITDDGWQSVSSFFGTLSDNQKRSIAVHQNTVHTPEVICQALYAAVHHSSPLGVTCTAGTGGAPIIEPPARAAAVLTLDYSGSMTALTCPNCPTRAAVLEDAVELFIQLWSAVSVPSDSIGVNYFSTNVTTFLPTITDPPPPLSTGGPTIIADLSNRSPSGLTAMGGGLLRAIDAVKRAPADTQIRRVILFTDGMQNVNPMVQTVGNQLVFGNQAGRPNSNVPEPSPTPVVLDANLGVAVDTIGIGTDPAFVGLLQDISSRTGGRSWPTADPAYELRRFFIEELINALKGFSPQLAAYRHGAVQPNGTRESFNIEAGVDKLVLKVSWQRGDSLDFTVAKDGVDVSSAGRFIGGPFYKIFVIDLPTKGSKSITARGNWEVRMKANAGTAYEAAAIVDGGQVAHDAMFLGKRPRIGRTLDLVVRATAGQKPIDRNTKVSVSLKSPKSSFNDIAATVRPKLLPAFEPGMSVTQRRLLSVAADSKAWAKLKPLERIVLLKPNDKGEFRMRLRPKIPGIYTALVTIEGEDAKLGKFTRTVTAVTVVPAKK